MRILCVDDDEDTRGLLEHLLEYPDLEAIAVQDTQAAFLLIERERFSLYIIDGQQSNLLERIGVPGVRGAA